MLARLETAEGCFCHYRVCDYAWSEDSVCLFASAEYGGAEDDFWKCVGAVGEERSRGVGVGNRCCENLILTV